MDKVVRELLTVPTLFAGRGSPSRSPSTRTTRPFAFVQANEFKPENVAAAASRLFMGVKIECAQCHNHPFAPYKKEQFWELAAFFAEVQPAIANLSDPKFKREIKIPDDTPKVVQAQFFDDRKEPAWDAKKSPRETFADWLTSPDNPFFARNMANRAWAHFLGPGLIDPIDEPSEDNPPVDPGGARRAGPGVHRLRVRHAVPDAGDHPEQGVPADQQADAREPGRPASASPAWRSRR